MFKGFGQVNSSLCSFYRIKDILVTFSEHFLEAVESFIANPFIII
jgi:hypothetical protein